MSAWREARQAGLELVVRKLFNRGFSWKRWTAISWCMETIIATSIACLCLSGLGSTNSDVYHSQDRTSGAGAREFPAFSIGRVYSIISFLDLS